MPSEIEAKPLTVAVVGATGLVGETMIRLLEEREFPVGELRPLASRADGRQVYFAGRRHPVAVSSPDAFDGVDVALFSAGSDVSARLTPEAARRGAVVIDNSSHWRMADGVPLVVVDVNSEDAAQHDGIIANPNCSTMQLVPLLKALHDSVGLERVIVDTYQSVSGTGADAVAELEDQIRGHVDGRQPPPRVYPHRIGFNALPEIDSFLEDGYTKEEWKVIHESRKILHLPELALSCTAVRVPVFYAHSEAVHVDTRQPISPAEARALFADLPGVVVMDEPAAHLYPLATEATGRDEVFVGRVRADASRPDGRGLAFWVVADNLRKGAATNAVQIAELVLRNGWLRPRSERMELAS
ncbi:MAG TPA: aspartate-semialdehyde dehydrogenase [Candidatus Limnocylindria bacterium]|nr:aspartate-semialdehyde dehydrogenase [Candidatus Limnocylindria bacterium]